jgi:tetratricopeptide (TPR) repeat protein
MKLITSTAIVLVAGLAAAPAAAQYGASSSAPPPQTAAPQGQAQAEQAQGPKINLSGKAQKAILDLQTAVKANDVANIPAKLAAAQAVAQSKDDRYAIGVLQRQAALAANDNTALAAAVDALANSGFLDPSKVSALYLDLGVHQFNAKQYPQAVAAFQKAATLAPNDPQAQELLAQGLAAAGQNAEAAAAYQRMFQARAASGQKPGEDLYKRAVAASYQAKSPTAIDLARQWVAAYPSPDSWHDALAIYRNIGNPDPAAALDIMRLARATKSMQGTADYNIYAAEVINASNYGEARAVIDEGIAAGKIKATDPVIADIQKALKGKPSPTAAELASREAGAKVPTAYLRIGDAYYGAGNYAKAADMYRQAVAKGGDANLANLRLGEALAMAGDKAGAAAALAKVTGSQAEIAKFWLTYTNRSA